MRSGFSSEVGDEEPQFPSSSFTHLTFLTSHLIMIGFLSGTIHSIAQDNTIVMVNGVGYIVYVLPRYLSSIHTGEHTDLFIHTHVREDILDLYGFSTQSEFSLFKLVLTVSGIGPKTALLVVDRGAAEVQKAVQNADTTFFTHIPRLGKKNAQKLIIELKNKLGGLKELDLSEGSEESNLAVEALKSMGYTREEAIEAINAVPETAITLEEKINYAFKTLGKRI